MCAPTVACRAISGKNFHIILENLKDDPTVQLKVFATNCFVRADLTKDELVSLKNAIDELLTRVEQEDK